MRKRNSTNQLLANAFRQCLQDAPIDKISIKAITDACGLNRQTFYYHFRDIYDLVKWMYLQDIEAALKASRACETWEGALRVVLAAFDKDREFHLAIYDTNRYYPDLRHEFLEILAAGLAPAFAPRFEELGYDGTYCDFLIRLYSLVLYEFVEKRARGVAFSTVDGFVDSWSRSLDEQFQGALVRKAAASA